MDITMINFLVGVVINLAIGFLLGCIFCYLRHQHASFSLKLQQIRDDVRCLETKMIKLLDNV